MRMPFETRSVDQRIEPEPVQPRLRPLLALREFVLGNLTLEAAAQLADLSGSELLSLLDRVEDVGQSTVKDLHSPPETQQPRISVVIPVFNEEGNLPLLHSKLSDVLGGTG